MAEHLRVILDQVQLDYTTLITNKKTSGGLKTNLIKLRKKKARTIELMNLCKKLKDDLVFFQEVCKLLSKIEDTESEWEVELESVPSPPITPPTPPKPPKKSRLEEFEEYVKGCNNITEVAMKATSIITQLEVDNRLVMSAQKLTRCIMIFRQKIQKLETRFSLTCDIPVSEMQSKIYSYVRDYKSKTTEAISAKLDSLMKEEKTKVLNFFNQDTLKNLSEEIFRKWKDGIKVQIEACPDLRDEEKKAISELVTKTNVHLDHLKIVDQYPVHFNARFTKWVYYLMFSIDKRATEINEVIANDPNMDLFSFCVSVAKLYATTSKLFHPASKVTYKEKLSFADVMEVLQEDLHMNDQEILKSAEIILKAGVKKELTF